MLFDVCNKEFCHIEGFNQPLFNAIKPHVLIVDDDEISAAISFSALKDMYSVSIVHSGEAAISFCSNTPPDLILLDIEMPNMDGLETCHRLKKNDITRHIRVIFVTGHVDTEHEEKCWEAGCIDFVTKPFSISTLRHRVNAHMNTKLLTDELRLLSSTDGLTGLYNRRYFDAFLLDQLKLAARDSNIIGLLLIDIDLFKVFNDTYGHLEGDNCIRSIAKELKLMLNRPTDCIARYGGEEFVVVLPNTDFAGVKLIASNILNAVRALNIEHTQSSFDRVTVSIGGAISQCDHTTPDSLIGMADKHLYDAKQSGRNQLKM